MLRPTLSAEIAHKGITVEIFIRQHLVPRPSGGADMPWMSWTLARLMPTSRVPKKTSLR